jgi:hypothetical protein
VVRRHELTDLDELQSQVALADRVGELKVTGISAQNRETRLLVTLPARHRYLLCQRGVEEPVPDPDDHP